MLRERPTGAFRLAVASSQAKVYTVTVVSSPAEAGEFTIRGRRRKSSTPRGYRSDTAASAQPRRQYVYVGGRLSHSNVGDLLNTFDNPKESESGCIVPAARVSGKVGCRAALPDGAL